FEYQLPNRTVTVCPTYSLVSLECPQVTANTFVIDQQQTLISRRLLKRRQLWKRLPVYIISIDYVRSFPSKIGLDHTCQPDFTDPCYDYAGNSLPYLTTLCSGKTHCSDIQTYQIRDRSLCQFKAVTEIGYHCLPTWYNSDIQTKCDICKNGSLTNDYGFIYSRNYPQNTVRTVCYTTIYARPDHKTILYYVNGSRRESRSDFNLHDSQAAGVRNEYFYTEHCPRRHPNQYRTMHDFRSNEQYHRSLAKSFSDCELCKRLVVEEEQRHRRFDNSPRMERVELPNLFNRDERHRRTGNDTVRCKRRKFDDWDLNSSPVQHDFVRSESSSPPPRRTYREKIKERFRERLTYRKHLGNEIGDSPIETNRNLVHDGTTDNKQIYHHSSSSHHRKSMHRATRSSTADLNDRQNVEYSTVLPRNIRQRTHSESNLDPSFTTDIDNHVRHLPVEYVPLDEPKNTRTVQYRRNSSLERLTIGDDCGRSNHNNRVMQSDDNGTTNFTVKFYDHHNNRDEREIQEMSMKVNEHSRERGRFKERHVIDS
ncbi:unnamed protein product, partial [Didymodactylos carnosus]